MRSTPASLPRKRKTPPAIESMARASSGARVKAGHLIAIALLLGLGCRSEPEPLPPPPPPALSVEFTGCASVRIGPVCELPADRGLRLWIQAPAGVTVTVDAGTGPIAPTGTTVQGGILT